MNELHIVETGEVIEEMTHVEAERITSRIADKLDSIADDYEQVVPLIGEALTRNAWKPLGYSSPTDYVSERFSGALKRLPLEVRRPVVKELSEAGMSTRVIAPIVGVNRSNVTRDLQVVHGAPPEPKSEDELLSGEPWTPSAEPETTSRWGLQKSDKIIGPDGKQYTRPEPKPEPQKPRRNPLPDQARTAGWEVRKSVERIERIMEDDRFTRNKEEVAAHLRGHLQYAIETLQTTLDQLN